MTLVATVLLAVLIGVTLGLLGGGGSILTVPILVYVAGQDPKAAIVTSLVVVGVTSAAAALGHARAGRVQWRTGLVFGGAAMIGAYFGGRVGAQIPGDWLLVAFGLMMTVTAVAMLRARPSETAASGHKAVWRTVLDGALVGFATGLVGAGGGFLIVPALALLGGLPMATAVGTSLVVIAMKSVGGVVGYLSAVEVDWALAAAVTMAAVGGSVIGGRLAGRVHPDQLRRAFAWFVIVVAVFLLGQQVPAGFWEWMSDHLGAWWIVAGATGLGIVGILLGRRRRRHSAERAGRDRVAGSPQR